MWAPFHRARPRPRFLGDVMLRPRRHKTKVKLGPTRSFGRDPLRRVLIEHEHDDEHDWDGTPTGRVPRLHGTIRWLAGYQRGRIV